MLITSLRAHDIATATLLAFGKNEIKDLRPGWRLLQAKPDVDPERIGVLGNSLGGSLVIELAADNPGIKAIVANCAFSSLSDTIETSVRFFTNLPPFPFAPLITFWAEREAGFRSDDVDAKKWIGRISPRPILLMQGGADVVISKESGQRLYDAAGEPKELWSEPDVGHAKSRYGHFRVNTNAASCSSSTGTFWAVEVAMIPRKTEEPAVRHTLRLLTPIVLALAVGESTLEQPGIRVGAAHRRPGATSRPGRVQAGRRGSSRTDSDCTWVQVEECRSRLCAECQQVAHLPALARCGSTRWSASGATRTSSDGRP